MFDIAYASDQISSPIQAPDGWDGVRTRVKEPTMREVAMNSVGKMNELTETLEKLAEDLCGKPHGEMLNVEVKSVHDAFAQIHNLATFAVEQVKWIEGRMSWQRAD